MHIHICIYIYIYIRCVCMYVCVCIYIYIYMYTCTPRRRTGVCERKSSRLPRRCDPKDPGMKHLSTHDRWPYRTACTMFDRKLWCCQCWQETIWKHGPRPWELWAFDMQVNVTLSNRSGIWAPRLETGARKFPRPRRSPEPDEPTNDANRSLGQKRDGGESVNTGGASGQHTQNWWKGWRGVKGGEQKGVKRSERESTITDVWQLVKGSCFCWLCPWMLGSQRNKLYIIVRYHRVINMAHYLRLCHSISYAIIIMTIP